MIDIKEDYEVLETIGRGSFSKVYKAKNKENGKLYAIKAIDKKKLLKNNMHLMNIINEIEVLRNLNHPNIVKLYEVYESNHYICLVMEYIQGGDLFHILETEGIYSEAEANEAFKCLLKAISYCHSVRIMHRDLKPSNIAIK